eukprot:jgi/Chlat1/6067/Chrsp4S06346
MEEEQQEEVDDTAAVEEHPSTSAHSFDDERTSVERALANALSISDDQSPHPEEPTSADGDEHNHHNDSDDVGSKRDEPAEPLNHHSETDNMLHSSVGVGSEAVFNDPSRALSTRAARGKKYKDEDDTSPAWRRKRKHLFVLSNAGKPIFSRYGDENRLAGFTAVLQAVMSFVQDQGDTIHWVKAGRHVFVFLARGPLYLLELIHGQLISILTSGVERVFERSSGFDMRSLLGGTEPVLSALVRACGSDPAVLLHAFACLPLPHGVRRAIGILMQRLALPGLMFGVLLAGSSVVTLLRPKKQSLQPSDIILLTNFICASESFRISESFSPFCLPAFNPKAFLYAYVHYISPEVCLILLTADRDSFYQLAEARSRFQADLKKHKLLEDIAASLQEGPLRIDYVPCVADAYDGPSRPISRTSSITSQAQAKEAASSLQVAPSNSVRPPSTPGYVWEAPRMLRHYAYRHRSLRQLVCPEFPPWFSEPSDRKRVLRTYQSIRTSAFSTMVLAWLMPEFELYVCFEPSIDKLDAIAVSNKVLAWVREREDQLLLCGSAVLTW